MHDGAGVDVEIDGAFGRVGRVFLIADGIDAERMRTARESGQLQGCGRCVDGRVFGGVVQSIGIAFRFCDGIPFERGCRQLGRNRKFFGADQFDAHDFVVRRFARTQAERQKQAGE